MTDSIDCVVIGAGVVGLAIARTLAASGREVIVLEAAGAFGTGTSSRNSEVLHAGLYYATGSLKATLCVAGQQALYRYCEARGVEHRRTGKIIVASSAAQVPGLGKYAALAAANGVTDLRMLSAADVRQLEPEVRCAAAVLSPSTGIVDSHGLMLAYVGDLERSAGTVVYNSPVVSGELRTRSVVLNVGGAAPTTLLARTVINAAGLEAQSVSGCIAGVTPESIPRRYLARGHYFTLSGPASFRRLVYPLANAAGLGVHVTLDLAGRARFGPDVQWIDAVDYSFPPGLAPGFASAIGEYFPAIEEARLQPAYTGIRPKLVGEGQAAADFCIRGPQEHGGPYVALYGIESPGLTASLALAGHVAQMLHQE
jgi:L-2-hydroxyglutarate oxidase LhgO